MRIEFFSNHRFGGLAISLVFVLFVFSFIQETPIYEESGLLSLNLLLYFSLHALFKGLLDSKALLTLGSLAFLCSVLSYLTTSQSVDVIYLLLTAVFYMVVIFLLFRRIFYDSHVTSDLVTGAACIYLLLGITFGLLFTLVDYTLPHSFNTSGQGALFDHMRHFFYYSFVTLATVGYGDILPTTPQSQFLSIAEAVISQLYLTIMVARLVGLHTMARDS